MNMTISDVVYEIEMVCDFDEKTYTLYMPSYNYCYSDVLDIDIDMEDI